MVLEDLYEKETGEKALYRKGSSDYHTLRYVRWLEGKLQYRESMTHNAVLSDGLKVSQNLSKPEELYDMTTVTTDGELYGESLGNKLRIIRERIEKKDLSIDDINRVLGR